MTEQGIEETFTQYTGGVTPYKNRASWLYLISWWCGVRINDIPALRKYLKSQWGRVPLDCGSFSALEAIAFRLGVPGAKDGSLNFPEPKTKSPHPLAKSKLSKEEIIALSESGKSLAAIASLAGISRERVRQIVSKK